MEVPRPDQAPRARTRLGRLDSAGGSPRRVGGGGCSGGQVGGVAVSRADGWHDPKLPEHGEMPFSFVGASEHFKEAAREYAEIYARKAALATERILVDDAVLIAQKEIDTWKQVPDHFIGAMKRAMERALRKQVS